MNDAAMEGKWVWSSGETPSYSYWAPSEPNNSGGEDYALMNWNAPGQWNDVPSYYTAFGIAEWSPAAPAPAPAPAPVPVPETYAMLLAGLGLLGFAARRRRQ